MENSLEVIEGRIFFIRGMKVMLDRDLAELYGLSTMVLNQSVRRNAERFPEDFMFRLTNEEKFELITNCDRLDSLKFSTLPPLAFTHNGVAMLSSILRTSRAVQVNIAIMRAFTKIQGLRLVHEELARRFAEIEAKLSGHDKKFDEILGFIQHLIGGDGEPPHIVGFRPEP